MIYDADVIPNRFSIYVHYEVDEAPFAILELIQKRGVENIFLISQTKKV